MSTAGFKDASSTSRAAGASSEGAIPRLLERARLEGRDAVGELLQKYANYLRLLAITHMDARLRSRVSPSDVVQETNCDVHRDFPQFRGNSEGEFVAWLRTILVHNLARMIERHVTTAKRDVRREISLNQIGRSIERSTMRLHNFLAAPDETPSSNAVRRERAVVLADHLAALADDHRQVIVLRNLEGRPFSEVAEQMERSEGAVRMLWLRAVEALKCRMQRDES